jgi:hypothetical protein
MGEYANNGHPSADTLRAQADKLEQDAAAISDASEYPRVAKFTVAGQVAALREYASTIESEGDIAPKRAGMTGEERRERRASILRLRAARLKVKANDLYRASHDIGSRIPFGQPILVGHHSERGHRRAIDKMHNATAKAYGATQYAETLDRRADHVERRPTIQASDSDAVEQYREKLAKLTAQREQIKATNNAWRKFTKSKDAAPLHALGFDDAAITRMSERIATAYSWEKQPHPGWELTNLGARIRDVEQKIERLERDKATPEKVVESAGGVRLEDCPQDNRLRLFFPGKPDEATRTRLKGSGFRWAPSLGCWQAYRNTRAHLLAQSFVAPHNWNDAQSMGKRVFFETATDTVRACPENYCLAHRNQYGRWERYSDDGGARQWWETIDAVIDTRYMATGEDLADAIEKAITSA